MKRTNTAKWVESAQRWQINVQKDGKRKTFTSTKPGRTGQLRRYFSLWVHTLVHTLRILDFFDKSIDIVALK